MATKELDNWADHIGLRVYVAVTEKLRRRHTSGVIKRLTKTMIIVETADGETYRFRRFGVPASDPYRYGSGHSQDPTRPTMTYKNYMGLDG